MFLLPMKCDIAKDLKYKNPESERKYQKSKATYQRNFSFLLLLLGFLIGIIDWAVNPSNKPYYESAPHLYRVVFFILLSICAVIAWRKPSFSESLILFLTVLYFCGWMEISLSWRHQWSSVMFFLTGMNTQFLLIPAMLAKISWKATCFLSLLINTLTCFRYTDFEENYKNNFYPLIQYIVYAALISASAYLVEKYDRGNFNKILSYEYSVAQYMKLIKNWIPCAAIITTGQKILFNNEESLNLLGCLSAEEVWDKLGEVNLERPLADIQVRKDTVIRVTEEVQENGVIFENQNLTLQDVAIAYSKNQKLKQEVFNGEYEKVGIPKALDVKIMEIHWGDSNSLLILISENLMLQKLKHLREEAVFKNRILGNFSHDLKTPLSGIIGMINMTLENTTEPQIRKYLKIVHRSSKSLLYMVNDILDYTRLSVGGITLHKELFSLWDCILEIADLFKFQAKMKNIKLEKLNFIRTNNQRAFIINDKNRVKQVIFNLLGNALKFTVVGFIKISLKEPAPGVIKNKGINKKITVHFIFQTSKAYEIRVEDTGIGIKEELQRDIFKLFGKLPDSDSEDGSPLRIGFGLPLSQSLVKILNHNKKDGIIKIESEYKKGSLFSFVIYQEIQIMNPDEHPSEAVFIDNSKKICNFPTMEKFNMVLIIDSRKSNIELISNQLKSFCDFIFDEATNDDDALSLINIRAASNLYYNLILVDCDNTEFMGVHIAKMTKTLILRKEIPFVPVIGLSSDSSSELQIRSQEIGMTDTIVKPYSNEVMKAKLEKYIM